MKLVRHTIKKFAKFNNQSVYRKFEMQGEVGITLFEINL